MLWIFLIKGVQMADTTDTTKEVLKSKARSLLNNIDEDFSKEEQIKALLLYDECTGFFDMKELIIDSIYTMILRLITVVDDDKLFIQFYSLLMGLMAFMGDNSEAGAKVVLNFIKGVWKDEDGEVVFRKVGKFLEQQEKASQQKYNGKEVN